MSIEVPNTSHAGTTKLVREAKQIVVELDKQIITIKYVDQVVDESDNPVGAAKAHKYCITGLSYAARMAPVSGAINDLLGASLIAENPQAFIDAENEALANA